MRRPKLALSTAVLATAISIPTLLWAQVPQAAPDPASDPVVELPAYNPMASARSARSLLRNGRDYNELGEYERALEMLREAETRKAELSEPERLTLQTAIQAARNGLRSVDAPATARTLPPRRGSARQAGSIALQAPETLSLPDPALMRTGAPFEVAQPPSEQPAPLSLPDLPQAAPMSLPELPPSADTLGAVMVEPNIIRPGTTSDDTSVVPVATPPADPPIDRPAPPVPLVSTPVRPSQPLPDLPAEAVYQRNADPLPGPAEAILIAPEPDAAQGSLEIGATEAEVIMADPAEALPPSLELEMVAEPAEAMTPLADSPDALPAPAEAILSIPTPDMPAPPSPPLAETTIAEPTATLVADPIPDTMAPDLPPLPVAADSFPEPAEAPIFTGEATEPSSVDSAEGLLTDDASAVDPESLLPPISTDLGLDDPTFAGGEPLPTRITRQVEEIARRQQEFSSQPLPRPDSSTRGMGAMEPPLGMGSALSSADPFTELGQTESRIKLPRPPSPTQARPIRAVPVPEDFVPLTPRQWNPSRKVWAAAATCHGPLYFQDAVLERYGQSVEQAIGPAGRYASYPIDDPRQSKQRNQLLQPLYSIGLFATQIAALPYNLVVDPPWEAEYDLGYYRPGDRIPPDTYYLPTHGVGPFLKGKKY